MRRIALALLLSVTGCAAASAPDAASDEAAITAGAGGDASANPSATSERPTSAEIRTDRGNRLTASILVDPPTGAGWASPTALVRYEDSTHAYGGTDSLVADVTVHFSAPAHDTHATLDLRLDNSGGYLAPFFLDLADVQHVEGLTIAVGDGHHWDASDTSHERTYSLGAIRPDGDDAASISPYDHVAIRGFHRTASLDNTLALSVDLDDAAFTREEVPGYDGHGQAFALVPAGDHWDRIALAGSEHFVGSVPSPDRTAIAAKGIAFGVTTNRGTIWLQDPHGNLKP